MGKKNGKSEVVSKVQEAVKRCSTCKRIKKITSFSKCAMFKDGHYYRCKKCISKQDKIYYSKNKIRSYKLAKERGHLTYKYRKERLLRYRIKNKLKIKARSLLKEAVKKGIVKRLPCKQCGNPKSHGHHSDYKKPLKVIWLCQKHHTELHNKLKNK